MNHHQHSWQKLVAAARLHHDPRDEAAPYGFAVRVASQATGLRVAGSWGLLEKFALRGLIAACAFSVLAIAFGSASWTGEHEDEVATTDIVGEILDLS